MLQTFDWGLWLPLLAMILGLVIHSLSADGAASLLSRFGIAARVPAGAIPPLVLVLGAAAGVVDAVEGGADLKHAIATALTSTILSLGGVAAHHMVTASKDRTFSLELRPGMTLNVGEAHQGEPKTGKAP